MKNQKIAIVYDWMDSWGGVERMLLTLHEMYPDADWYTSYVDPKKARWVNELQIPNNKKQTNFKHQTPKIQTSFIQKLPSFIKSNRILSLPFYPYAFESFDFRSYDTVLSVTSSFAKSIITHPHTKHVCILLTPTRWLWSRTESYKLRVTSYKLRVASCECMKSFINWYSNKLKRWDYVAAQRPDKIISISQTVADRCKKQYGRESTVVYPPFDEEYWEGIKLQIPNNKKQTNFKFQKSNEKYFLVVSRLEPYKKVDLVIEAFASMPDKRLIIIGTGTQASHLQSMATSNITFIQNASDTELAQYYSHAQALIMAQEEDFGYVSIEAQYFGCPVITYQKGGAVETIIDGITGTFVTKQTHEAIRYAVAHFKRDEYNLKDRKKTLSQFSKNVFINTLHNIL